MSNKVTKNVIIKMTKIGNQVTKHINKGNRAYQQRNKNVNRVTKHVIKGNRACQQHNKECQPVTQPGSKESQVTNMPTRYM